MARLKNIEKVAQALGMPMDNFGDGSASWVLIENDKYSINIEFDGKGDKFTGIAIAEKIYQVVDEKIIATIQIK